MVAAQVDNKKETMKKFFFLFVMLLLSACQKADDNGDLGGFWKLLKIEDLATNEITDTKDVDRFWAIQLDLLSIHGSYGRFQHVGDSLFVQMIHVPENAKNFGLYNPKNERYGVNHLDRNRMVLQSEFAILTFRKF